MVKIKKMTGGEICSNKKCTGCWACVNICPKSCISMQPGILGHLYPVVNQSKCIDCKLCHKICPENNGFVNLSYPLTAYVAWHKVESDYLSSTSGGAATAFAQYILKSGGVVYGCASSKGLNIEHVRIGSVVDVALLKGSKYVQSFIGDVYQQIRQDLNRNLRVLFIGTPCQCAGLKNFLKEIYENLYCVDLICHGVPSQKLLKSHVRDVSMSRGALVSFRKGNDMGLRIFDNENRLIYYSNVWYERFKDTYYNTFIDGYTYRDSCYRCRYANPKRCSDVTIGDFWGLGEDLKHDNINGCSCILPISEKGLELVKSSELELHERSINEAINGNAQLRTPKTETSRIKLFRAIYRTVGIKRAYLLCETDNIFLLKVIKPIKRRLGL